MGATKTRTLRRRIDGKNYLFPVSNGVFGHYRMLRDAIWLLLLYVDCTTIEEKAEDATRNGLVLGGRPINDGDVARELGCGESTARRWRNLLAKRGYIKQKRTPYGYIITVRRSKKWAPRRSRGAERQGSRDRSNIAITSDQVERSDLRVVAERSFNVSDENDQSERSSTEITGRIQGEHNTTQETVGFCWAAEYLQKRSGTMKLTSRRDRETWERLVTEHGEPIVLKAWEVFVDGLENTETILQPWALFAARITKLLSAAERAMSGGLTPQEKANVEQRIREHERLMAQQHAAFIQEEEQEAARVAEMLESGFEAV